MFKYWSIKKYDTKLLSTLEKRYGLQTHYKAHEIRATVYQSNFNPTYLPLAYIILLKPDELATVMHIEFPQISVAAYKKEILTYLDRKRYQGGMVNCLE